MKGIKNIFAVCMVLPVCCTTLAAADTNISRNTIARTTTQNTVSRSASNVKVRDLNANSGVRTRTTTSRTSTQRPITNYRTTAAQQVAPKRTTTAARTATTARTALNKDAVNQILSKNYSNCKNVFNECMDEFCANKDAQLKRCACSARIHDFDSTKKQLNAAEDKLLDFSQRLLTVNLDKEDALAINTATEGEEAFYDTKDTTQSKRALDAIAKKLNTSFKDSNFSTNVSSLSWSLNADTAFDSVNSMAGASTTTKSGTALYAAALPICREMAREVCSEYELSIAENGYQMMIEQDCNTVEKSYKAQVEQTRNKILESSALLDMSRLDIYQKRNSDDILTCKGKMLDMLSDNTVCGATLEKCLDTTGRYIDPSTGTAFLTANLVDLNKLILRPSGDQTWASANTGFVSFLNSKRKYIESASENCQDIADDVWNAFIEDALAQIKLAQSAKLETVRQSCTTLSSQCLSDAIESIEDFDSRALSVFGVIANKTANGMCNDILNACSIVLDGAGDIWSQGMTEISTMETYETMMATCREVGRSCIIRSCSSISGNFGLCEDTEYSINRKAILNRYSCWDEVKECVASADERYIDNLMTTMASEIGFNDGNFYNILYKNPTPTKDLCNECTDNTTECYTCRLTEKIWGNCEHDTTYRDDSGSDANASNRIKKPKNGQDTLLYWFAKNTNSENKDWSCKDNTCPGNTIAVKNKDGTITCADASNYICGIENKTLFNPISGTENACKSGFDYNGHCCIDETAKPKTTWTDQSFNKNICTPSSATTYVIGDGTTNLFCTGTVDESDDNNIKCNGRLFTISDSIYKSLGDKPINQFYYNDPQTGIYDCTPCNFNGNQWECDTPPQYWYVGFDKKSY